MNAFIHLENIKLIKSDTEEIFSKNLLMNFAFIRES